ncbi:hypothetical protein UY3_04395 [Chelonia mydas]|uniref:Uncharacterized protein n=1 Tax=Chelonia mydas TaxID=8469 RepID=M7BKK2_CHEMY|nr:hypothetical protein UY3_04395 [Chelonia mydas]
MGGWGVLSTHYFFPMGAYALFDKKEKGECSEAVWFPAAPETDESLRTPEWVEPGSSEPPAVGQALPWRDKGRTSGLTVEAAGLAREWESPVACGRPEDWPDLPSASYPEESPSLSRASYHKELPSLPLASYPEEPMVLDPPEDTTLTQVPQEVGSLEVARGAADPSLAAALPEPNVSVLQPGSPPTLTARTHVSVLRPGSPLTQQRVFCRC